MKLKYVLSVFLILLLPVISFADLNITVEPNGGWGTAPTSNIKKLCENVALHFQEQLRDEHKVNGRLTIAYRSGGPIAYYRSAFGGGPDEYKIGLKVTDTYWAQFSYQFGHEFCHIMQNHDKIHQITPNNSNYWFQEAICELATLWVIRKMGETWAYRAPYPNWVNWRHNLTNYANDLINRPEVQYSGTGGEWLARWEEPMRHKQAGAFTYARVSQFSYKFLPIFEENPEAWTAVRQMPASNAKMSEYMKEWYDAVDTEDKSFVEAIATEMGFSISNDTGDRSDTVSLLPASVQSPNTGQQPKLSLKIANGENVAGYQATVQFDDTALRFVSGKNGDFFPAGAFFVEPKDEGNLVRLNAASLADEVSGDGILVTLTFEVITVKASTLTLSDVLFSNSAGETFAPQVENAEITEPTKLKGDVNGDGVVNIADLVLVASNLGETGQNAADINNDGQVNIADLVLVAGALGTSASAPSLHPQAFETLTATDVKQWLSAAQQLDLTDTTSQRGILFLQQLLIALTPKETALLPNYPNPFNPETWIPYHLAENADVTLHIYAVNGTLVRMLTLGHQPAGIYQNRSRAAYWDGKNAVGESVASGVYLYTFTAGDFTATRKMLIVK